MEHATSSSSGKVTVEYTDPSNLYQAISQDLARRLPLKNLHWNSSSRPLRSIKSLHIELLPDDKRSSQSGALSGGNVLAQDDGSGQTSIEQSRPGSRPAPISANSPKKERRHQIPGLRQTPYLKIYLLQCDSVDTYKASSRKLLREWVKDHTPPSQKSSKYNTQENHDAFEWLILHVVSPADILNSRRGSADSKDSRWSKRSSSNLIEKIRTDFNGTSKSAVDRVAQVYLSGETTGQSSEDGDTGWGDLIFKLKSLILASFDLRVRQYEEDIKERESQRSLPGWNFNTFFVLKEGLAKGFESVGLIEDALTSYHELAAGLQSILDARHTENSSVTDTARFQDYTDDLLTEVTEILDVDTPAEDLSNGDRQHDSIREQNSQPGKEFGDNILQTDRKPFRELILANQISVFDFQCYIFARQASLLLRLGNRVTPASEAAGKNPESQSTEVDPFSAGLSREPENLLILADVCQRAVEFITSACRTMRNELRAILNKSIDGENQIAVVPPRMQEIIVEDLTASWTYSAAECVLSRTSTQSLSTQLQPLIRQLNPRQGGKREANGHFSNPELPRRTSSLSPATSVLQRPPSPEKYPSLTSLDALRLLPPHSLQSGAQDLAADRAALYSLQRRALSTLGLSKGGWKSGWPNMHLDAAQDGTPLEEVSLDDVPSQGHTPNGSVDEEQMLPSMKGVRNNMLRAALSSEESFYAAYETITAKTLALYVLGERKKSAEALTADLAAVRFYLQDYPTAAAYFRQLAPFYAQGQWSEVELVMLDLYARCLENLDRKEEYVNIVLKIVAKQVEAVRRRHNASRDIRLEEPLSKARGSSTYLESLIAASKHLGEPVVAPMERYIEDVSLDPQIQHHDSEDTFFMILKIKQRMQEKFSVDEVRVRLVGTGDEQGTEIYLTANSTVLAARDVCKISVASKIMHPGIYNLDRVSLRSANIILQHVFSGQESTISSTVFKAADALESRGFAPAAPVNVYPDFEALHAMVLNSKKIHLQQPRSLEVHLLTGRNDISHGKLLLKAGSGGLRLHTADAVLTSGDLHITSKSRPGMIEFDGVNAKKILRIRIPYSVESDLKEIVVKLEIAYTTGHGDFSFACSPKISILLPLGVNVQDIFKEEALFSKFSIFTANSVPIRLLHCRLEGNAAFKVSSPPMTGIELDIFARQPVTLMAKIHREQNRYHNSAELSRRLSLQVQFICLDEEVSAVVEQAFTASIAESGFKQYTWLLTPYLLATLRSRLSVQDYEVIGLLREVNLGPSSDFNWSSLLTALPKETRQQVLNWLSSWHTTNPTLPLPSSTITLTTSADSLTQYLTVPVEIPHLQILHTAHLRPLTTSPHIALDQALAAELTISHTRRWGTDTTPAEPLEFVYEITAPPDTWLIGGQRKAHFSAAENESVKFGLLLLPQRTGHLLFPSLEIRPVAARGEGEEDDGKGLPSCETDYVSQADTVLVIPDLESTTVSLDPSGNGGNVAWVLETRARDAGP